MARAGSASREAGGFPLQVEVSHAGNRAVVAVGPKELARWKRRAAREEGFIDHSASLQAPQPKLTPARWS